VLAGGTGKRRRACAAACGPVTPPPRTEVAALALYVAVVAPNSSSTSTTGLRGLAGRPPDGPTGHRHAERCAVSDRLGEASGRSWFDPRCRARPGADHRAHGRPDRVPVARVQPAVGPAHGVRYPVWPEAAAGGHPAPFSTLEELAACPARLARVGPMHAFVVDNARLEVLGPGDSLGLQELPPRRSTT